MIIRFGAAVTLGIGAVAELPVETRGRLCALRSDWLKVKESRLVVDSAAEPDRKNSTETGSPRRVLTQVKVFFVASRGRGINLRYNKSSVHLTGSYPPGWNG